MVGAGLKLNAPMIGQGDFLQAQVNYTEGALKYIFQTPTSNWFKRDGSEVGFGQLAMASTAERLSVAPPREPTSS